MHTKFIKNINRGLLILAITLAATALMFTSCDDDDDDEISGLLLESYGPMPIARGAELRFIGVNMDQVTSVVLPSNIEISDFNQKSSELITITVPQNAEPGIVTLQFRFRNQSLLKVFRRQYSNPVRKLRLQVIT